MCDELGSYAEVHSLLCDEGRRAASGGVEYAVEAAWERVARVLRELGFIAYDAYNPSGDPRPQIVLFGEVHGFSHVRVASALERLASEGEIIVGEGRNRVILPKDPQFYPRSFGVTWLTPELFGELKARKVVLVHREYPRIKRYCELLGHQQAAFLGVREIAAKPVGELDRQDAWNLQRHRHTLRYPEAFLEHFNGRDAYFGGTIAAEARNYRTVYGVFGMAHVLYPVLRRTLRERGVSYLASVDGRAEWIEQMLILRWWGMKPLVGADRGCGTAWCRVQRP